MTHQRTEVAAEGAIAFWAMALRHPHCRMVLLPWIAVFTGGTAAVAAYGDVSVAGFLVLFAIGWGSWTFWEYQLHRFVMHWHPKNRTLLWFREWTMPHDGHHRKPLNPRAVFNSVQASLLVALGIFGFLWLFVPADWSGVMVMGGAAGYLAYEMLHFAIHQWPMKSGFCARLRRHHLIHHFLDEHTNFGVTTTIWDRVFGTLHPTGRPPAERGEATAATAGRD